jgi:Flp pilus assembly protein TadG
MEETMDQAVMGERENRRWVMPGSRQSGQSLVEFAIALPLLSVLLFGIIQYGFIFATYITLRNASSIGARQAIINSGTGATGTSNIVAAAANAVGPLLDPNQAQVTVVATNLTSGSGTSVQVSYPLKLIISFVVPGVGNNSTRTITATTIVQ